MFQLGRMYLLRNPAQQNVSLFQKLSKSHIVGSMSICGSVVPATSGDCQKEKQRDQQRACWLPRQNKAGRSLGFLAHICTAQMITIL